MNIHARLYRSQQLWYEDGGEKGFEPSTPHCELNKAILEKTLL